jgi:hypothetical protein
MVPTGKHPTDTACAHLAALGSLYSVTVSPSPRTSRLSLANVTSVGAGCCYCCAPYCALVVALCSAE